MNRRSFLKAATTALTTMNLPLFAQRANSKDGFIELVAGPSQMRFLGDKGGESQLWTYNKVSPGPPIRVKQGERVKVRLKNSLPEPTSIHWHGIRIENSMDGVSGLTQDAIPPGETYDYEFLAPDAGTYWYHAHNKSWNQVARGLYGPLIVDEVDQTFDPEHDLTLVIDDWRITRTGELDLASLENLMDWSHAGRLGNWLTVNGRFRPEFMVNTHESYRVRLINAANSRVFSIDPNQLGAEVIAYDGISLPAPQKFSDQPMQLGPGQRVDLLFTPASIGSVELSELSGKEPYGFVKFNITGDGRNSIHPLKLRPPTIPEPDLPNAKKVQLIMRGGAMGERGPVIYNGSLLDRDSMFNTRQVWSFNNVANLSTQPLFSARHGETIIVELINRTAFPHAMHVHGHHFRVAPQLDLFQNENIWRDTFMINPDQTTKIAFVADNPGKWLLHCHMLEHAAAGMNTWFEVA